MSMLNRLMKRLHRVFDKDPRSVPAIQWVDHATITISDGKLTALLSDRTLTVNLTAITIAELVAAINAGSSPSTLTIVDESLSESLAMGLLETTGQNLQDDSFLWYPTSLFYNEMQVYSAILRDQRDRLANLERQLYLNSATDSWLTYWCHKCLGIPRSTAGPETDAQYLTKTIETITSPTQNNVALEGYVMRAFGIDIVLSDANRIPAFFPPDMRPSLPGRMYMQFQDLSIFDGMTPGEIEAKILEIKRFIDSKYKAAGIGWIELTAGSQVSETMVMQESVALSNVPAISENFPTQLAHWVYEGHYLGEIALNDDVHTLQTDVAWVCGTPGIRVGLNDLIKEQIVVTLLDTAEQELKKYLFGG